MNTRITHFSITTSPTQLTCMFSYFLFIIQKPQNDQKLLQLHFKLIRRCQSFIFERILVLESGGYFSCVLNPSLHVHSPSQRCCKSFHIISSSFYTYIIHHASHIYCFRTYIFHSLFYVLHILLEHKNVIATLVEGLETTTHAHFTVILLLHASIETVLYMFQTYKS